MPIFYKCSLFLSLCLVKALRLHATSALLCSDRRCADIRPSHDIINFIFDLCSYAKD